MLGLLTIPCTEGTHPKFKLTWIEDALVRAQATQLLEQAVSTSSLESGNNSHDAGNVTSDDDDFSTSVHQQQLQRNTICSS